MWDERYAQAEYVFGTAPNAFFAAQAPRIPPGPVLFLAEGEGRNAAWLAEQGVPVTAVDASPVGLEKAQALAEARGAELTCVCTDLAEYTIEPGAWAGIVSIFGHLSPELRPRVHSQAASGLRPGGVFILEAFTPRQLAYGTGGPPDRAKMMDRATLATELSGLEQLVAHEGEREVVEGRYHTGAAHVVQLVARRPEA